MKDDDINFYNDEAIKALVILNTTFNVEMTEIELQIALSEKLKYDRKNSVSIAKHRLSHTEMIELLDFVNLNKPTDTLQINLGYSVLPEGIPIRLEEKIIKVKGEIWMIHKYDKDLCPSNPHGHHAENGYKLHLGDGSLYDYKCSSLNKKIKRNDLLKIRALLINFELPPLT